MTSGRLRHCVGAIGTIVLAVAILGCAKERSNSSVTTVTVHETATRSKPRAPKPRPEPKAEAAQAVAYVTHFYALLNQYRYREAWPLLPDPVQVQSGGFAAWRDGYRANVSSDPSNIELTNPSGPAADVSLDLRARDIDACTAATVTQWFSGTWHFERTKVDWIPVSIDMNKVSGPTPTLDASECAPTQPHHYRPPAPAPAAPSYGGGDLDCADVGVTNFPVGPSDPNGFDADGDGIGCES
jgi:hypothetical protein